MMIPYSFKLGLKEYSIRSPLQMPPGCLGQVHYEIGVIRLAWAGRGGRERTHEQRCATFWHEVTHAILHDMENPLWKNEKFVTEFSKRLDQVIRTARLT